MADAKTLEELAEPDYWNARYAKPADSETFEWFKSYKNLEAFFAKHMPRADDNAQPRILHLGCGNSTLPIDLYKIGYHNQLAVDFSDVVVSKMSSLYPPSEFAGIQWSIEDIRSMPLIPSSSIDLAIDKGTLDAMISGSLWDPPEVVRNNTKKYIDEVVRVLKPGARFLYITYRQPHFMKPLLIREGKWELKMEELRDEGGTFEYFGFIITKNE